MEGESRRLTQVLPQQHREEAEAPVELERVVHDAPQRLLLLLEEASLKAADALRPLDRRRRVLLAHELKLADHPGQRDVAHLERVGAHVLAGPLGLAGGEEVLDALPDRPALYALLRVVADGRPAAADVAVAAGEPDLPDVFGVVDGGADVLGEQRRLELNAPLVDGHGVPHEACRALNGHRDRRMALEDGDRVNAVPDAEEVDLDVPLLGRLAGPVCLFLAAEGAAKGRHLVARFAELLSGLPERGRRTGCNRGNRGNRRTRGTRANRRNRGNRRNRRPRLDFRLALRRLLVHDNLDLALQISLVQPELGRQGAAAEAKHVDLVALSKPW
ncbi:hypothetical protein G6O67_008755 [Ophiocordyceps sinensis]|uniref:Uncharacterized protein n=1 Tax=Ophiocordyceps sinensis TaxID=72228 RepID=A0A8H4PJY1_9HYPO|nr:hypothetical protein G6O67_008755 [Ophiocordyceps sinensis]